MKANESKELKPSAIWSITLVSTSDFENKWLLSHVLAFFRYGPFPVKESVTKETASI